MTDITTLMNTYRECSRNLWNVYFAKRENVGGSLDAFDHVGYEGREALLEATGAKIFHDESADQK
jgi:hypothetical protein